MISVEEALSRIFALVSPIGAETVPLQHSMGRVLRSPATALRSQPPFASSAMDGYAARTADAKIGATLQVIGESAAGARFHGAVGPGECVRIFTGAPVPTGADRVIIQEDTRRDGNSITLRDTLEHKVHIRPLGADFREGEQVLAPKRLTPADIALLAAMNIPKVEVARKPDIALIATGDELVMPGDAPGPDQIMCSNTFALKALLDGLGAQCRLLPIAKDTEASLNAAFDLAAGADLIITTGGASVGDHDLVAPVAQARGMSLDFHKICMRPGKPLMAGRMGPSPLIGLPGNPVSSLVCGHLFLVPAVLHMLGLPAAPRAEIAVRLQNDIGPNGPRRHYMRAQVQGDQVRVFNRQDSALLSVLAEANALVIRPEHDGPRKAGDAVQAILLDVPH